MDFEHEVARYSLVVLIHNTCTKALSQPRGKHVGLLPSEQSRRVDPRQLTKLQSRRLELCGPLV